MSAPDTQPNPMRRKIPGAALIVAGSLSALVGGATVAAFGTDGTVSTDRQAVVSPANAIVTQVAHIRYSGDVTSVLGTATVTVSAHGGRPAFVGVARAKDVDRYLAGASTAKVSDLGYTTFRVGPTHGRGRPSLPPPGTRRFWVARAGSGALRWHVRDGRYKLVVMSADGRRGVATRAKVAVGAAHLSQIAFALLFVGLFGIAGGVALIARAPRDPADESSRRERTQRPAAPAVF